MTWRDSDFIAAWNNGTWSYNRQFPTSATMTTAFETLLVFDGIRMGAVVELNGHFLGNVTDQFLRYEFPVSSLLKAGENNLVTVTFDRALQLVADLPTTLR